MDRRAENQSVNGLLFVSRFIEHQHVQQEKMETTLLGVGVETLMRIITKKEHKRTTLEGVLFPV